MLSEIRGEQTLLWFHLYVDLKNKANEETKQNKNKLIKIKLMVAKGQKDQGKGAGATAIKGEGAAGGPNSQL